MINDYKERVRKINSINGWIWPYDPWNVEHYIGEKLMLVVTEVSEAMEAVREDDRKNFNWEIADTFIRLIDICDALNIDIDEQIETVLKALEKRPFRHGGKRA